MKYFILAFFFISACNCQLIQKLGEKAESVDVEWFQDMVDRMKDQLEGKKLKDMFLSPIAPLDEVIVDLIKNLNISKVKCVKLSSSPGSNVVNDIEAEVITYDGLSKVLQFATKDNTLSVITKDLKSPEKNVN